MTNFAPRESNKNVSSIAEHANKPQIFDRAPKASFCSAMLLGVIYKSPASHLHRLSDWFYQQNEEKKLVKIVLRCGSCSRSFFVVYFDWKYPRVGLKNLYVTSQHEVINFNLSTAF